MLHLSEKGELEELQIRNTTYVIQFSISYDDYSLEEKSTCLSSNCITNETNNWYILSSEVLMNTIILICSY